MKIIKLLDLIYPPVCGICSKGKNVYLCKKCEKILQIKEKCICISGNR